MKMIKEFEGIMPEIDESVFVAESADIIGDVKIGKNSSVWYNTVLRGDEHAIRIGENTNIQDGTVVHVGLDVDTVIGDNVTVGHNALVHGCKIGNNSLVGMGAIVLNGAEIGEFCMIGAGALVTQNKKFPDGMLIIGSPAKAVRELTEEEKQEYLTIININSRRATKIITDLFEFSLLDSMDYKLNMKNVDVNEVLREIVAYYIPELEAKDFNYDFNISEEEYLVNIDEVKFTRAISNLIDNAIKYNEKNTTLSVISRKFNDRIEIRIFDDGRGINEEIRDKIFEAFVREDKARSSSTEGAGLGLAITKAIIEKHSGSIKLLDNTKGTEYKIILNI